MRACCLIRFQYFYDFEFCFTHTCISPIFYKKKNVFKTLQLLFLDILLSGFELTTSVVIGTDCISSCKSNYYAITAATTPNHLRRFISYVIHLYYH